VKGPLQSGKLPAKLLGELLAEFEIEPARSNPLLGKGRAEKARVGEVRLGPALGEDACAIDVPEGTLVAATDPITLTGSDVGSFAVTINANDIAVMGVQPRWFMAMVLLPIGTTESEVRALFASIRHKLDEIGATLVGGHTEITGVVSQPIVVGQMMGFSPNGRIVPTHGVDAGDVLVQVGPAPIEAAVVLADQAAHAVRMPPDLLARASAASIEPGISVVEPALLAAQCGAKALHDPTEGGLSSGLHELARASRVSIEIDEASMLWFEPGVAVCRALDADPWGALASGTLLAAFAPERVDAALQSLQRAGFEAARIGSARTGDGVFHLDGRALVEFDRDEVARVSNG
jgi:hydrogenase expression/formation protein HypE